MDLEAVGGYIILLCHQWNEGSVPADGSLMARICRTTPERMQKIWPQIAPKFSALRRDKTRLVNPKLEIVRNEKMRFSLKQANSGERGAQKRWTNKPNEGNGLNGVVHESAIGSRWASYSSGSSSGSGSGPDSVKHTPPSQEGGVNETLLDPDELPFATILDRQPFPPEVDGCNNHSAAKSEISRAPRAAGGLTPEQETWWAEFWPAYWRKRGKKEARAAFRKLVTNRKHFPQGHGRCLFPKARDAGAPDREAALSRYVAERRALGR